MSLKPTPASASGSDRQGREDGGRRPSRTDDQSIIEKEESTRTVNREASELPEPKSRRRANIGPSGCSSRRGAARSGTEAGWMPPSRRWMVQTSSDGMCVCVDLEILISSSLTSAFESDLGIPCSGGVSRCGSGGTGLRGLPWIARRPWPYSQLHPKGNPRARSAWVAAFSSSGCLSMTKFLDLQRVMSDRPGGPAGGPDPARRPSPCFHRGS